MTTAVASTFDAWVMTVAGSALEHTAIAGSEPGPGEALIEVAGCGVCHTDLSYFYGGVKTRGPLPLVLGHEISGIVKALGPGADPALLGKSVVVPAVLPCGECDLCKAGRRAICRKQVMPGNDRHGGFASHVVLPARYLCPVPPAALKTHALWELAAVADALSTPFQAVRRSGLQPGDLAIVVGVGGIGIHAVQVAKAAGGKVIALDVDARKLEQAKEAGADAVLDVTGMAVKDVRKQVRLLAESAGAPAHLWKIFETSGTRAGQETAWALLGFGASLGIVGYTMDKVEIPLSNLMAFDADAHGNWGADPLLYPELVEWIADGRLRVSPYVEKHRLAEINAVFEAAHHGHLVRRAVLVP